MSGDTVSVEDVASWLERCVRVGRLSQRIRLAEALRDGSWRDMPARSTADRDVPEALALHHLWERTPLTVEDVAALRDIAARRKAAKDRQAREMQAMADAFAVAGQDAGEVP